MPHPTTDKTFQDLLNLGTLPADSKVKKQLDRVITILSSIKNSYWLCTSSFDLN
jgi:hypothetical protein